MPDKINLKNIRPRKNAPGGGRPVELQNARYHNLYIQDEDWTYLKTIGGSNAGEGLREAIRAHQLITSTKEK